MLPLPHFGAARRAASTVVGVDLGTSRLRVAVLRESAGAPTVVNLLEAPIPAGAVIEGRWVNPAAVVETLSTLLAQHGVLTRTATLSIGGGDVHIRTLSLPPGRSLERQVAENREMRSLPGLNPDRAAYGGWRVGPSPAATASGPVLGAAARGEAVDWLADLAREAGLQIDAVDPEAVALANTFRFAVGQPPARAVLLHIGAQRCVAVVLDRGVPATVYPIREGLRSLVKTLRAANPALTSEAAIAAILAGDGQALSAEAVATWAGEIAQGVLRAAGGAEQVGEVYLTGGGVEAPLLTTALTNALGVDPQLLDPLGAFGTESTPVVFGPAYAVALGLALGALPGTHPGVELIHLHLRHSQQGSAQDATAARLRSIRPAKLLRHPTLVGVLAVAAMAVIGISGRDLIQNRREAAAHAALRTAQRQASLLGDSLTAVTSIREQQDSLRRLVTQIGEIDKNRFGWLMLRDELARVRPPLTWITSLVKNGQDAATGVIRFTVTGHSPSPERAAEYARALEASGLAEGLLTRTRSVEIRNQSVHHFEISGQTRAATLPDAPPRGPTEPAGSVPGTAPASMSAASPAASTPLTPQRP